MKLVAVISGFAIAAVLSVANAQSLTGPPADPQAKYSTSAPPGVAMPASPISFELSAARIGGCTAKAK